jgi:bacteriocin biosynthesis cyclodehydratase domain-containing protein
MPAERLTVRFPLHKNVQVMVTATPQRELYLKHGGGVDILRGKDAQTVNNAILPRINGFSTAEEVSAAVEQSGVATVEHTKRLLRWLIEAGICVEDCEDPGDGPLRSHFQSQIQYFSGYSSFPTRCQKRLQASRVAIFGLEYAGSILVQGLAAAGVGHLRAIGAPRLLAAEAAYVGCTPRYCEQGSRHTLLARRARALGFATQYEGIAVQPGAPLDWTHLLADCHLAVLILPVWLPSMIKAFNQACLAVGIPFLPVWFEDSGGQVGPLVIPYETACLLCCELRQRSRWTPTDFRAMQQQHADATGPVWDSCRFSIPWVSAIAAIATGEIVTALAQERQPAIRGQTICIDPLRWHMQATPVLKVPRCPACSRLRNIPSPQPFALHDQKEQKDGSTLALP